PDHVPITQSDRTALKANILPLLAASPIRSITVQLAATLKNFMAHDFPNRWSSLVDGAKRLLRSRDMREVGAGIVAALECVSAFRYLIPPKADILPGTIASLSPTLVTIADSMLKASLSQPTSQEIPAMLHLILKTYKIAIII
ncbi:hypothetical protein EDB19DRAFT_1585275, partial [Suillus lakei]